MVAAPASPPPPHSAVGESRARKRHLSDRDRAPHFISTSPQLGSSPRPKTCSLKIHYFSLSRKF